MERIVLTHENQDEAVQKATWVLRGGGVILFPTDTLYGLGADAFSDDAVAKIYEIKGRNEGKPVHAIVEDLEMADRFGVVTDDARFLAERLPLGLVTFIVKKRDSASTGIVANIPTFGFRIPDNAFCNALLREFGAPITATSANKSGEAPPRTIDAILEQLGGGAGIELAIDAGELPPRQPSTVLDVSAGDAKVLREGAVSVADIEAALG